MFRTAAVLLVLLLTVPAPRADAAPQKGVSSKTSKKTAVKGSAPGPAEAQPAQTQPAQTPPPADAPVNPPAEPDMDFDDLLEPSASAAEAPLVVDPELEKAIARRRTMLTLHQGLGLATAVTLAATVVVGQLHFDDRYRGFGDTGRYRGWHTGLVVGSTSLFAGTGLLGLLAPTPYKKDFRWDTVTFHKVFMSIATAGMLSQVILGRVTGLREGQLSQVDLARAHQAIGYATVGALSLGVLMLAF